MIKLDSEAKKKAAKLIQEASSLLAKDGVSEPSEWLSDYALGDMGGQDDRDMDEEMEEGEAPKKMLIIAALKKKNGEEESEEESEEE